jgi:hypothetical protein
MRRRWRARKAESAADLVPAPDPVPALDPVPAPAPTMGVSAELVRLLEVVTTMCDHMIGFVEADREDRQLAMQADRAERRAMVEALSLLIARMREAPAIPTPPRERVIGGSMYAGPETGVDLRDLDDDHVGAPAAQPGTWSPATSEDGARTGERSDHEAAHRATRH